MCTGLVPSPDPPGTARGGDGACVQHAPTGHHLELGRGSEAALGGLRNSLSVDSLVGGGGREGSHDSTNTGGVAGALLQQQQAVCCSGRVSC